MPFARYFCIFINVGLGEGSALPVGVPVPWPSATPPTGWLKCNGAAFSAEEYPELARLIRQINCLIYVVSLFVAGMMGAALIQGVRCCQHKSQL